MASPSRPRSKNFPSLRDYSHVVATMIEMKGAPHAEATRIVSGVGRHFVTLSWNQRKSAIVAARELIEHLLAMAEIPPLQPRGARRRRKK
jgi:hypothetical protein